MHGNSIPNDWKVSIITPVYKGKGKKCDVENYRPISVLSPIAKIFETIIGEQLADHFESNNLFCDEQFGFRKKLSCEDALNTLVDQWRFNLDNNLDVLAIFLDLKKAFDTIDHELLLIKLRYYNVNQNSVALIKD